MTELTCFSVCHFGLHYKFNWLLAFVLYVSTLLLAAHKGRDPFHNLPVCAHAQLRITVSVGQK